MNKKNKKRRKIAGGICGSAALSLCAVTTAYATGGDPLFPAVLTAPPSSADSAMFSCWAIWNR